MKGLLLLGAAAGVVYLLTRRPAVAAPAGAMPRMTPNDRIKRDMFRPRQLPNATVAGGATCKPCPPGMVCALSCQMCPEQNGVRGRWVQDATGAATCRWS